MKLSPKQKKWGKRILIFLCIRIILGLVFFYIVDYRFKDLIRFAVKDKSNHAYDFDSGEIEVSLFKKNLTIKNAVLYAVDTLHTRGHYQVRLKEVYFAMNSWKELIFHQRLIVDSVTINSPLIFYHQHEYHPIRRKHPHVGDINLLLHRLLRHLRVKSLQISNAAYAFKSKLHPERLTINNINFSLRNFSNLSARENLFNADDFDLQIGKQQINLPDRVHSMSFSHLRFSGRKKYLQLDSFYFVARTASGNTATSIASEKLKLKSDEIADIFKKDELNIDTLEFFKPIIDLKGTTGRYQPPGESRMRHLFKQIHFKFINVEQGIFTRQAGFATGAGYGSDRVDLQIYDLKFKPGRRNALQIQRIKLDADRLNFKSKDGKTQLSVEEMAFDQNAVIFTNANYGQVNPKVHSGLSFETPLLMLKSVSFAALLEKRVMAEQADLVRPIIKISSLAKPDQAVGNKADFRNVFKMFHVVKSLFGVKRFNIKNGTLMIRSERKNAVAITVDQLNANILAERMLNSDTTLEIKHAIPMLSFKRMKVSSPKLKLNLSDYIFYGKVRHNRAKSIDIKISDGTFIKAKQLYWEWLDWDLYQRDKMIFIDSMKIGQLNVAVKRNPVPKTVNKSFPKVHLGRLDIKQLYFDLNSPGLQAKFMGKAFFAREINSSLAELQWLEVGGELEQLHLYHKKMSLMASKLNLHTNGNNRVEQLLLRSGNDILKVPELDFKAGLSSTNLKKSSLDYLKFNSPEIYISNKRATVDKPFTSIGVPTGLEVKEITVRNGRVFNQISTDSIMQNPISRFDFVIHQLRGYENSRKLLSARSFTLNLKSLDFANQLFTISAPVSLTIKEVELARLDSVFSISGSVIGQTENLALSYRKGNNSLNLRNMSMSITDPAFNINIGRKLNWQQFINKLTIKNGGINIQNADSRITVQSLSWLPEKSLLSAKGICYRPLLSLEEFRTKNPWQTDYLEAAAGTLTAEGMHFSATTRGNEINVSSIILDSLTLNSSRDKRMKERPFMEKPMPSKLVANLKIPVSIHEIKVTNGQVNISETSFATGREGVIILNNINADITNLNNQQASADSLKLNGHASLFGKTSVKMNYRESYQDSLSTFKIRLSLSPMNLREINQVSIPLAALEINKGDTDGINAEWEGNKYFARGEIFLPYKNLSISVLDKRNLNHKSLLISAESDFVNMMLRKKNLKPSFMLFERNRNKFVFNYWIKTLLTGFASSVGIKSERKLKKHEEVLRSKYKSSPTISIR